MTELQWTPERVGALTPTQLMCLLSETPPGVRPRSRVGSMEEYLAAAAGERARAAEDEAEWRS